MQAKKSRLLHFVLPGLLAVAACTSDPVTTVNQNNLGNLTLPGNRASSIPSASPIVLNPSASPSPNPSASSGTSTTVTANYRVSNVLVWEVKPSGKASPVSYLVGTVHAPFAADYSLPAAFVEKLGASKDFYMEANIDDQAALASSVAQQAVDPNQSLQSLLGNDYWAKLKTRLTQIKQVIPDQALNFFKPWFIDNIVGAIPDNTDPKTIMDLVLRERATKAGLSVKYLELASDELAAIQAISATEHIRMIKLSLDQGLEKQADDQKSIFDIYNRGDLAALTKASQDARAESEEYYQNLVKKRNQKWIQTLAAALRLNASVVAVGSLHMVDSDGLVSQLQAQGYDVSQVTFK